VPSFQQGANRTNVSKTIRANAVPPGRAAIANPPPDQTALDRAALAQHLREVAQRLDAPQTPVTTTQDLSAILIRVGSYLGQHRVELSSPASPPAENDTQPSQSVWQVLDQLPDAMLVLRERTILFANKQFCEVMEYSPEELVGSAVDLLATPSETAATTELGALLEVAQFEPMLDIPLCLKSARGEPIPLSISAQQASFGDIEPCMLLTIRDVSELKRLLNEAEAASASKSRFMANMTHEIRTPLSAMISLAALIRDSNLTSEQQADLQTIEDAGGSLLSLVNDILDLTRLESDHMGVANEPCNLDELLLELERLLAPTAKAKKLKLKFERSPRLPESFTTDGAKVRQVLINLIGNAIKFTEVGSISVQLEAIIAEEGPAIAFEVRDTGAGIPEGAAEEIFRPFHQLDNGSNREHEGSGLGLSISQRLAQVLGGRLLCTSQVGVGSCFTLILPCDEGIIRSLAPRSLGMNQGDSAADSETAPLSRYPILVAEDNVINQRVITGQLNRLGWSCALANDGQQALEMLSGPERYELVLMDCQMPRMDGLQATKAIREMDAMKAAIPIIAITANSTDADRKNCLEAGMDDFMAKPVTLSDLRERLEAWASESRKRIKAATSAS